MCFNNDYYEEIDAIREIVYNKVQSFIDKYQLEPKYIKVPLWVYLKLCEADTYIVHRHNPAKNRYVPTFLGL